jgi:hypothetical protein
MCAHNTGVFCLLIVGGLFCIDAAAEAGSNSQNDTAGTPSIVRHIRMDKDRRTTPVTGNSKGERSRRFSASGLVRCGNAVGTAQLTLRADVITTAAHIFIDQYGRQRTGSCTFEPTMDGKAKPIPIETASIKTGSRSPWSDSAMHDWAVAKLKAPIPGVTPYRLTTAAAMPVKVAMCAGGNGRDDRMGAESCMAHRVVRSSPEGIREVAIDCNAEPGSSGAAVLDNANHIVGIHVGFRSTNPGLPQPFSDTHYNFAITVDGPFRRALLSAAANR